MLDPSQIRAITLDLDDTLWPIWPTIQNAEERLLLWLKEHAPVTAQMFSSTNALREIRLQVERDRPDLHLDLSGMRLESIRRALRQAGEDENLAMAAFEIFFDERHRVQLFEDVLPLLEFASARWPVVAITNGNADVHRVGLGTYFQDSFSVARTGFAKPDVRIFQCAAKALALPVSAILHVGDDAKLDAVAARDAGMHAVWLNRAGIDWPLKDQPPPISVANLTQLQELLAA